MFLVSDNQGKSHQMIHKLLNNVIAFMRNIKETKKIKKRTEKRTSITINIPCSAFRYAFPALIS